MSTPTSYSWEYQRRNWRNRFCFDNLSDEQLIALNDSLFLPVIGKCCRTISKLAIRCRLLSTAELLCSISLKREKSFESCSITKGWNQKHFTYQTMKKRLDLEIFQSTTIHKLMCVKLQNKTETQYIRIKVDEISLKYSNHYRKCSSNGQFLFKTWKNERVGIDVVLVFRRNFFELWIFSCLVFHKVHILQKYLVLKIFVYFREMWWNLQYSVCCWLSCIVLEKNWTFFQ